MIQRNGFVSNSSSSSFVLVVTEREHLRAMGKLTTFEQAVVRYAMKEVSLPGLTVMVYHDLSIMDNSLLFGDNSAYIWQTDDDGKVVDVWEVMDKYEKLASGFSSKLYDN